MSLIWRVAVGSLAGVVVDTPVGRLRLSARGEALVSIDWADADAVTEPLTPLLKQASGALLAYFQSPRSPLDIALHPSGTEYQRRVWQAMAEIPPGQVKSYGQLAQQLQSGARAVAAACRANPYPLIAPCHRVVAAHGLGGYCGASDGPWLDIKRWLLAHEQAQGHG